MKAETFDAIVVGAGQADLIASGGRRDLLSMGSLQGIAIITVREAAERLEARGED